LRGAAVGGWWRRAWPSAGGGWPLERSLELSSRKAERLFFWRAGQVACPARGQRQLPRPVAARDWRLRGAARSGPRRRQSAAWLPWVANRGGSKVGHRACGCVEQAQAWLSRVTNCRLAVGHRVRLTAGSLTLLRVRSTESICARQIDVAAVRRTERSVALPRGQVTASALVHRAGPPRGDSGGRRGGVADRAKRCELGTPAEAD